LSALDINILFRWHTDDGHGKARNYSEIVWKPALVKAGMLPSSHDRARNKISERFTQIMTD
jgi:hypothetical protein